MGKTWNFRIRASKSLKNILRSSNLLISQSVQSLNPVWFFVMPWTAACQASLSFTISQSFLKLMFIKMVMPSNHLVLCCPLFLLLSFFSKESVLCIRWPKYWSFNFSISPSNEYSGLISFRIVWFDLLVVQGTLKSLLQHHSSKPLILWCLAFFIVQLSHPYMTIRSWLLWKTPQVVLMCFRFGNRWNWSFLRFLPTLGESEGLDCKERAYKCFTPTMALFISSWSRHSFGFVHNMDKLECNYWPTQ